MPKISSYSSKGTSTNIYCMAKPYTNFWQTSKLSLILIFLYVSKWYQPLFFQRYKYQLLVDDKTIYKGLPDFKNPNNNKRFLSGQWVTFSQKLVQQFCWNFYTSYFMPWMRFLKRFYEFSFQNKKVMTKNVKYCYCVSVPVRVSEHVRISVHFVFLSQFVFLSHFSGYIWSA